MTDGEGKWLKTSAGIAMPPILYGTAWKKERTGELVELAIRAGFRGIDTAGQPKHYSEALVGEGLKGSGAAPDRSELFLQTKFTPLQGQDPERLPYAADASLKEQLRQSVETSCANLQTDYIDSYILHSPLRSHTDLMEVWRAMEDLYDRGTVRQLGISNCYTLEVLSALYADARIKPAVVQNRFYAQTGYDAALRSWCEEHHLVYQGFWTLTANPHILDSAVVRSMAHQLQKTPAQVFFRYLTQRGIVPLTGTTSTKHMQEDLDIFAFKLDKRQLLVLDELFS